MDQSNIEEIVRQVLNSMGDGSVKTASGSNASAVPTSIPKTAHVAVLTALEHFDVKEYPIPPVGDGDILVKVEGCGVCGTDAHEFRKDPFNLIPVALGHEGTGTIVAMGKDVRKDSAGKDLKIGDKVVTCMIFHDNPDITMFDLNKQNVGGADVYGLLPDDDVHLNGWFSDYLFVRKGSTIFNVSDLDLDSRILIEPCAVLVHAVERAKSTGILRFNSRVAVQGCGPIGLICIAVLRTMGIQNIVAVDGNEQRLEFAKRMGAERSVNFMNYKGIDALAEAVSDAFDGHLADFAFQCTGNPHAHSNIYHFVRNGGGLCELGFFINGGDATINPHFDICSKELTMVGSWVYTLRDYATTFDFLKRAKAIGLPMSDLITDKYPLDQINEALKKNLSMTGLKIAVVNKD
ncbi:MAG: zinc-binding dehydrogenase [Lachnospiraceae bacterium]|nr:zinc-binding dehydrogenase [Lachnospiraceae bacterium]NLC74138.1 zinc-binding dehydrogenase [Clostridiales bacterium]